MYYKHSDLIFFELPDPCPKCGGHVKEVIGQLVGRTTIPCPRCGTAIRLDNQKAAIDHLMDTAAQLDVLARKGK